MRDAFTSLMLGHAPLVAWVSDRVHWSMQPAQVDRFPYINLTVVSDPRRYHFQGVSDLRQTRVQLDVWAESCGEAVEVEAVVDAFLSGFSGDVDGISFRAIMLDQSGDLTDRNAGSERQLFRQSVDLFISWKKGN